MMRFVGLMVVLANLSACGGEIGENTAEARATTPYANVTLFSGVQGIGRITSSPALVNCTVATCNYSVAQGAVYDLTASPSGNFRGWDGGYCVNQNPCHVTMSISHYVYALMDCVPGRHDCGCPGEYCCDGTCGNGLECGYDYTCQ